MTVYDKIISERERKIVAKKFKRAVLLKQVLDLEIEIESDEKDLRYFLEKRKEKLSVD